MEDNLILHAVLTVEEAADLLKVSKVTIRRWCADGKLPAFKIGREWRINKLELEKLMGRSKEVEIARGDAAFPTSSNCADS